MTGNTPVQAEVPPCTPGELLFAPSYLPLDLVPTPDGRSLVVVDRGFLALREPTTLKVQRYLLPQVDGWVSAALSPDGRTLTAQTFDGQRYAFDTSTWKAERLTDARVFMHEREAADVALINAGAEGLEDLMRESFQQLPDLLHDTALIQELTKQRIVPLTFARDESRQRLLMGEPTGALTLLDLAGQRILQRVPCEGCSPYVYLRADADGFLGVTMAGQLRVLDRELKVVREVGFLPPQERQGVSRPRLVRRLIRVGEGSRLAWLTRDHELGVFDLGTGSHVVRLSPLGLGGAAMAALLDTRRLALLSEGTLRIWDMVEQRVLLEKQGPYPSALRLDAERILVTREDGFAEVLSTRSGEVLRRFCATHLPCGEPDEKEVKRRMELIDQAEGEEFEAQYGELQALASPRYVGLLVSPDQHTLVAVSYPTRVERGGPVGPGSIGAWRLPGLEPLGMRSLSEDDVDGEVRFGADGALYTGGEPLSVPGLPAAAGNAPRGDAERLYSGGALTVRVRPALRRDGFYDEVILSGPGEKPLGVLAEMRAESRRGQLRRESFADVLPSGERFLVAGGTWAEGTPFGGLRFPSGPTEVWCSPRETPLPRFPEAPPQPEVMEIDGLTEVGLAQVPSRYEAMAATGDGSAWLLASDLDPYSSRPPGPQTLWRLTPGSPRAERLEPPPQSTVWEHLATAPDDGSLWALGQDALAHREADGRWTVHPLPAGEGHLNRTDFLALPGGRAVVLRGYIDTQRPNMRRLRLFLAGPGPALAVTDLAGGGVPMPLVPLPDGFLFLGTRASAYESGPAPALVPGFRFLEGKRLEKDALLTRVRELQPERVWPQGGRVLVLTEPLSGARSWVELDARTGKVLKQQELEQFFGPPGNAVRLEPPKPRPAREPQAAGEAEEAEAPEASRWDELPQWVDHQGKVIGKPNRYIPAWLRLGNDIVEEAVTAKGTWLRLGGNVLLFWDGARLSAYFHPDTRQHGLQYAE